jgi:Uma2 family endonuclease
MSAAPRPRLATYEDLLAYPEHERVELLDGVVVAQASPLPEHMSVQFHLVSALMAPFELGKGGPGGWWILGEVDVRFTVHDVVRPDIVGWRQERSPSPWGKRPVEVVPEWICEVSSSSTKSVDRGRKMRLFGRHGVPHYWVVEPFEAIEAFVLKHGEWVWNGRYEFESMARIPPFDAVELPLAEMLRHIRRGSEGRQRQGVVKWRHVGRAPARIVPACDLRGSAGVSGARARGDCRGGRGRAGQPIV